MNVLRKDENAPVASCHVYSYDILDHGHVQAIGLDLVKVWVPYDNADGRVTVVRECIVAFALHRRSLWTLHGARSVETCSTCGHEKNEEEPEHKLVPMVYGYGFDDSMRVISADEWACARNVVVVGIYRTGEEPPAYVIEEVIDGLRAQVRAAAEAGTGSS